MGVPGKILRLWGLYVKYCGIKPYFCVLRWLEGWLAWYVLRLNTTTSIVGGLEGSGGRGAEL
jgi:hypothetical protein